MLHLNILLGPIAARPLRQMVVSGLLLLVVTACSQAKTANPTNGTQSATSAVATAPEMDPADAIIAATKAQSEARSFRAKSTVKGGDRTAEITLEFVSPDRFRMVNPSMEAIAIGADTYMKPAGRPWSKVAMNINEIVNQFRQDPKMTEAFRKSIRSARLVGTEQVNGEATQVYAYDIENSQNGVQTTGKAKIWVRTSDGLPLKLEGDSTITTGGKTFSAQYSNIYSDYNGEIKIEPPIS